MNRPSDIVFEFLRSHNAVNTLSEQLAAARREQDAAESKLIAVMRAKGVSAVSSQGHVIELDDEHESIPPRLVVANATAVHELDSLPDANGIDGEALNAYGHSRRETVRPHPHG